jgi:hypothetical protein
MTTFAALLSGPKKHILKLISSSHHCAMWQQSSIVSIRLMKRSFSDSNTNIFEARQHPSDSTRPSHIEIFKYKKYCGDKLLLLKKILFVNVRQMVERNWFSLRHVCSSTDTIETSADMNAINQIQPINCLFTSIYYNELYRGHSVEYLHEKI